MADDLHHRTRALLANPTNDPTLIPCGPGILSLLEPNTPPARLHDLLRLSHAKLHTHPYSAVPLHWRRCYTDAALLLSLTLPPLAAIHTLDMALILTGSPGTGRRAHLDTLIDALTPSTPLPPIAHFPTARDTVAIQHPIPRLPSPPSLQQFSASLDSPFVIPDSITHWRALALWRDPHYLSRFGPRLVPVEVGRSYTDAAWSQRILPFSEFLETYIFADGGVGYLAQHDLFSQIPALRRDIVVPDYCYLGDDDAGEDVKVNAWFGPRGTVSPLHTDQYKNVFAQVVGRKYVRLYPPEETHRVFPRGVEEGGVDMGNTSRVDVEAEGAEGSGVAEEEWRVFRTAKYVETVLEPGECLYIPRGWWHYVRSLEVSFSVSFWWR